MKHVKVFMIAICSIVTMVSLSSDAFSTGSDDFRFPAVFYFDCSFCGQRGWFDLISFRQATKTSPGYFSGSCQSCSKIFSRTTQYWSLDSISYDSLVGAGDIVEFYCSVFGHFDLGVVSFSVLPVGCIRNGYCNLFHQKCPAGSNYEIPAYPHIWSEIDCIPAGCITTGSILFTCTYSGCNETKTETIPILGHEYVSNRIAPTCTTPGSITSTCSRCQDTQTETLPALYHSWESGEMVPSTYDEDGNLVTEGYTFYNCSSCGSSFTAVAGSSPPDSGAVSGGIGGEGMSDTTAALGKTFLSGIWALFAIGVPGFGFTFGQMWLGVLLASVSILVVRMIFGFGGGPRGETSRTSSTNNPRISKERQRDEF